MKKYFIVLMLTVFVCLLAGAANARSACFVVTAFNEFGESGHSEEVCCEMTAEGSKATLNWNAVDGATGYTLYYKPPWQVEYTKLRSVTVSTNEPVVVYAVSIFKLNDIPLLGITCEER